MPPKKRRGSGWEQRPKRSSAASAPPETQQPPEDVLKAAEIGDEAKPGKRRGIVSFAVDLWSSCYEKFFAAELAEVEAFAGQLPQSSYRARLKGAKAAAYDKKLANRVRQTSASHRRQTNQQIWTHSLVARSLSWYNQRVPHRIWRDVLEERVIASRPSCLLVLEEMRRVEPQPAWIASPHLFVVGADQTYMWQGCKKRGRGKQKAGEPPSPPDALAPELARAAAAHTPLAAPRRGGAVASCGSAVPLRLPTVGPSGLTLPLPTTTLPTTLAPARHLYAPVHAPGCSQSGRRRLGCQWSSGARFT